MFLNCGMDVSNVDSSATSVLCITAPPSVLSMRFCCTRRASGLDLINKHKKRARRPILYVPLHVNRNQKGIFLIVQYKYVKSCSGDLILQNLILRTRSCGTGFITQSSLAFCFHQTTLVWGKCFVQQLYQFRRGPGISGGPAFKYLCMIHRGGRRVGHG